MRSPRTVPVRGDKGFTELVQKINLLMARWGFRLKMHKGSASWLGWPNTEWVNETIWKLAYYGQNNMAFGGREEFLATKEKLANIEWPLVFGVPPHAHVIFVGFRIGESQSAVERIERILKALGEPDPAQEIRLEIGDDGLDSQLDALGM
jgi:hypothetical protein